MGFLHALHDVFKFLLIKVDARDGVEQLVDFVWKLIHGSHIGLLLALLGRFFLFHHVRFGRDPEEGLEPVDHEVDHLVVVGLLGDVPLDVTEGLVDDGQKHVDQDEGDGAHEEEKENGADDAVGVRQLLEVKLPQDGTDQGLAGVDEVRVIVHLRVQDEVEGDGEGEEEHAEEDGKVEQVRGAGLDGAGEEADTSVEFEKFQELQSPDEDQPPQHVSQEFIPVSHVLKLDVSLAVGLLKSIDQVVGDEEAVEEHHTGSH